MLNVAVTLAIIALSIGGSYGSPTQDKSVTSNSDKMAKDLMMTAGDMEKINSGDAAEDTVDLMEIMNQCNESFRIEMAYIDALDDSGSFPDETDRTPKCYVRCVLEHTGVASEDGKFDPERAAEVFAGERGGKTMTDIQDLAADCVDRKETCKCERSYRFMKCLMEAEIKEYESN